MLYIKHYHQAKIMLEHDDNFETIEQNLTRQDVDELMIKEILKQVKEEYFLKRRKTGFSIFFIGLIILLISFILTCINFHANQSITYVMFGISSVGLIVIFIGLYYLFG